MSRETLKAARYIQDLDRARCAGHWAEVPELVRKVRKHAPERSCLALAAETECTTSQVSHGQRPTTQGSKILSDLVKPLVDSIESETRNPEDKFQARVSLAHIYWTLGDHSLAADELSGSVEQDFSQLDGSENETANWTRICALKASYIKGTAISKKLDAGTGEALETFEAAMPILASIPQTLSDSSELRTWTELLLTQFCVLSSQAIRRTPSTTLETDMLSAFRAWTKFWEQRSGATTPAGGFSYQAEVSRRYVWKEYYSALSIILQNDLPYPTTSIATTYADISTRQKQCAELRRVEAHYESLVLKEVNFPRAEQASKEVEEWVDLVVRNWKIMCGSRWQEEDLGEGGIDAASRGVLDILYRAATKTFHSTSILRHLFTVHLAVADFDLAFKAFDTYSEIVMKGKARVEKTGELEEGLDDDETVLQIASENIRALCRYGHYHEAEKARTTAHFFKDWLAKHYPEKAPNSTNGIRRGPDSSQQIEAQKLPPHIRARIWGAIGIAEAQWARMTFDAATRSEIQLEAIKCLGKSLSNEYGCSRDIDSLFALALVFSERRELSSAIEVVKSALLPGTSQAKQNARRNDTRFSHERALIPLWHLLSLLLSARQEFTTASRACEGAFEQFKDPTILFGDKENIEAFRSEHLNEQHSAKGRPRGIVDEMDDFEKETIIEVKMTQLTLVEIMEGPEDAVNACDELLSLYSRLFGNSFDFKSSSATSKISQTLAPHSSAGTIRSLKGSIFGRKSVRTQSGPPLSGQMAKLVERPETSRTLAGPSRAPTIHVTNEHGDSREKHREKLQKRSGSLNKKKSVSKSSRSVSAERPRTSIATSSNTADAQLRDHIAPALELNPPRLSQVGLALSPGDSVDFSEQSSMQILPPPAQNQIQAEKVLKPLGVPGLQDTRLPNGGVSSWDSHPATRFSKEDQHRRRTGILVRVWLLIAGFYRRAEMYEDAKGAIDEAEKLVQSMEAEIARDTSGNLSIDIPGRGQRKSIAEQWGDVTAERGNLLVARNMPHAALPEFEQALTHFADHPAAIVGLSDLLLDIYTEKLLPLPSIPTLQLASSLSHPSSSSTLNATSISGSAVPTDGTTVKSPAPTTQAGPLGLPTTNSNPILVAPSRHPSASVLDPPHKASSTALLDRLAARDRAYGLLNGLTKLGSGWNYTEAWYTLARSYEEGGQIDKARDVLWWCVELEEGKGVRDWSCVGVGGYVL